MRNVIFAAQLVRHGMVQAQEGVGEGHAGDAGGIVHLLAGKAVAVIRFFQIGEHHLDGVQGQAVGVVVGHGGHIRLNGVRQHVQARVGHDALWHAPGELRVDDGNIRREAVVGQRVFDVAVLFIGDDREACPLAACAGGGGNGHQLRLCAQLRELERALADIKEALAQAVKAGVGVLVEQPHTLGRVNGAAAADGNNHVRLEGAHGLYTAHDALHAGVAFHIGINLCMAVLLALAQVIQHLVHIAQLHHHGVCDDKRTGDVLHLLQILDGILFEIDFGRHFEPLHIDSPFRDALFVDEVDGGDVLTHGVLAVRAAAQRKGRSVGVVDVADGALRGRAVDDDAAHAHGDAIFIRNLHVARVNNGRVAKAAQLQHFIGVIKALLRALHLKIGQHGAELFLCQRVVVVRLIQRRNEDLRLFRHLQAGLLSDPVRAFAHQRCEHALVRVREHIFRKLRGLLFVEEIAVVGLHIGLEILCNGLVHNHRLLRGTNHAVVERFGHHQVCAGAVQVC